MRKRGEDGVERREKKGQRSCLCDCTDNGLCAAELSGYKGHQCHADKDQRPPPNPPTPRAHARTSSHAGTDVHFLLGKGRGGRGH